VEAQIFCKTRYFAYICALNGWGTFSYVLFFFLSVNVDVDVNANVDVGSDIDVNNVTLFLNLEICFQSFPSSILKSTILLAAISNYVNKSYDVGGKYFCR
jgi:hypothetical protein